MFHFKAVAEAMNHTVAKCLFITNNHSICTEQHNTIVLTKFQFKLYHTFHCLIAFSQYISSVSCLPVRGPNKGVSPANSSVQLCTDPKINLKNK